MDLSSVFAAFSDDPQVENSDSKKESHEERKAKNKEAKRQQKGSKKLQSRDKFTADPFYADFDKDFSFDVDFEANFTGEPPKSIGAISIPFPRNMEEKSATVISPPFELNLPNSIKANDSSSKNLDVDPFADIMCSFSNVDISGDQHSQMSEFQAPPPDEQLIFGTFTSYNTHEMPDGSVPQVSINPPHFNGTSYSHSSQPDSRNTFGYDGNSSDVNELFQAESSINAANPGHPRQDISQEFFF